MSASLLDSGRPLHDLDLLRQLRGRRLSRELRSLAVIGAHRFDELSLIDKLFPGLRQIVLFEPLEAPLARLRELARQDRRLVVCPWAISDADGSASFHVTDNDGESSSLLPFGSHSRLFPQVHVERVLTVPTRRLDSALSEAGVLPPDMLIIDVQGAEHRVLSAIPVDLLARVRLIYTEVSTEQVYDSSGLLHDVERLLGWRFANLGFAPLSAKVPVHGNAVFVAHDDVPAALGYTLAGGMRARLRRWRLARRARRPLR